MLLVPYMWASMTFLPMIVPYLLAAMLFWRALARKFELKKTRMNPTRGSRFTPPQAFTWRKVTPADRATRLSGVPHFSCKHNKRDYMERLRTSPSRGTSPS